MVPKYRELNLFATSEKPDYCEFISDKKKMMINVESSPFQSNLFSQNCQSQLFLPDPDHDHCDHNDDENDDDIQQYWWIDYMTTFPAQFYTLLSPTNYSELFGEDEEAEDTYDLQG